MGYLVGKVLLMAAGWALCITAQADVWGYVDENGETHTAPTQIDSRYQRLTPMGGSSTVVESAAPTPTLQPEAEAEEIRQSPKLSVPLLAAPPEPAPFKPVAASTGLGRIRRESSREWMLRISAAPAVRALQPVVRQASMATGVDHLLLNAVIAVESSFDARAVSQRGALGLMQLMPDTADRYATPAERLRPAAERMLDPRINVLTGARMLADLTRRYERLDHAIAAWNAGEARVRKHGGLPPINQTRKHVLDVLELYWEMLQHQASTAPAKAANR
jgi:soluble lytic murein transglycosylase-like protein